MKLLLKRKIGLFICCMEKDEKAQRQLNSAYPKELINHAAVAGIMGGEFNFDKMNFLEKAIIKKVAGVTESVSRVSVEDAVKFAAKIN